MALYYSLAVYRDTYALIFILFKLTKEFNREYKYSIVQELKRDTMQLVKHIYRANQTANKTEHLQISSAAATSVTAWRHSPLRLI